MAQFFDISNWNLRIFDKPQKGSRPNNIYEDPTTGEFYFFKQSKASYPSEIWSEIVASKIGQLIGFNVLDYNVAFDGKVIGCISKSMINKEKGEVLFHGVDVLSTYIPHFKVTDKPIYSFQDLLMLCSQDERFKGFVEYFVELIVFDAIIGNTDRHTENWALIFGLENNDEKLSVWSKKLAWSKIYFYDLLRLSFAPKMKAEAKTIRKIKCSPIYDSGSCLGRDIGMKNNVENESEIESFLASEEKVLKYINKAKSEIRWSNERQTLFGIVNLLNQSFTELTKAVLDKVEAKATSKNIDSIVDGIDKDIANKVEHTSLSFHRKSLIKEIIKRRIQYLNSLL